MAHADAWVNSTLLCGDLVNEVCRVKQTRDVVVMGSASVAHALMRRDLVDEFRLLVFPCVLGEGERLFEEGLTQRDLELISAEQSGVGALMLLRRS